MLPRWSVHQTGREGGLNASASSSEHVPALKKSTPQESKRSEDVGFIVAAVMEQSQSASTTSPQLLPPRPRLRHCCTDRIAGGSQVFQVNQAISSGVSAPTNPSPRNQAREQAGNRPAAGPTTHRIEAC